MCDKVGCCNGIPSYLFVHFVYHCHPYNYTSFWYLWNHIYYLLLACLTKSVYICHLLALIIHSAERSSEGVHTKYIRLTSSCPFPSTDTETKLFCNVSPFGLLQADITQQHKQTRGGKNWEVIYMLGVRWFCMEVTVQQVRWELWGMSTIQWLLSV